MSSSTTDCVVVHTVVALAPDRAFDVFTAEIGAWWGSEKPKNRFRPERHGTLRFEPGPGGRLLEEYGDGEPFEVGRVSVWQPGERLVFGWRQADFAPGEQTEVEIRFEPRPRRHPRHPRAPRLGRLRPGPSGTPRPRRPRFHRHDRPALGRPPDWPARASRQLESRFLCRHDVDP